MSKLNLNASAQIRAYDTGKCDFRVTIPLKVNNEISETQITVFSDIMDPLSIFIKKIQKRILDHVGKNVKENKNNGTENCISKTDDELALRLNEIPVSFIRHAVDAKKYKPGMIVNQLIENITKHNHEVYVQLFEEKYKIIVNAPLVHNIQLPSAIFVNFGVEPVKFHPLFTNMKESKFCWYKSLDKKQWIKVGDTIQYDVKENDLNHYLKFYCKLYSLNMLHIVELESISENPVDTLPPFPTCPFEKRHCLTTRELSRKRFRVVSYNILADRYVSNNQFEYCPPNVLNIHYRKHLTIKELKGYKADIIVLQEVDNQYYSSYYKNEFNEMGYKSFYNRKGNCIPEGLLTAFKRDRYRLLEFKHIVFTRELERRNEFSHICQMLDENSEVKKEFKAQNTSLQVTVLMDQSTKNVVIVGNTHLYYHPNADHIRLVQAFMATTFLNKIKQKLLREHKNVAVIFCGDFNSHFEKSLYGFMTQGMIDPQHNDCLKISPSGNAVIYHKFFLKSASGTPKYTNYTDDYKGCLDYIFIETNKLKVTQNVPVTSPEELEKYEGLPNEYFPSDHLALVVDLEMN